MLRLVQQQALLSASASAAAPCRRGKWTVGTSWTSFVDAKGREPGIDADHVGRGSVRSAGGGVGGLLKGSSTKPGSSRCRRAQVTTRRSAVVREWGVRPSFSSRVIHGAMHSFFILFLYKWRFIYTHAHTHTRTQRSCVKYT